jgi:hypothetical protein
MAVRVHGAQLEKLFMKNKFALISSQLTTFFINHTRNQF